MMLKQGNDVWDQDIFIGDTKLKQAHQYEYLGMLIDDKLNMDKQVEIMYSIRKQILD